MTLDLQPVADAMATVTAGITDDQLDRPTPCPELDVAGLLGHVVGLTTAFRDAAAKVNGPTTSTPPGQESPDLPSDWRASLPGDLDALAAAWREPGATEGTTVAGGVEMPAAIMLAVASNELLVHGWDLAVATGQPFAEPAAANLEASYAFASQTPDTPEARAGLFGPVVAVPEEAPLLDRTLGYAGRDPRWTP